MAMSGQFDPLHPDPNAPCHDSHSMDEFGELLGFHEATWDSQSAIRKTFTSHLVQDVARVLPGDVVLMGELGKEDPLAYPVAWSICVRSESKDGQARFFNKCGHRNVEVISWEEIANRNKNHRPSSLLYRIEFPKRDRTNSQQTVAS